MAGSAFKICPCCGESWPTREAFIRDQGLSFTMYEADFEKLEEGLFYFLHVPEHCRTTMVIPAKLFLDLYQGPRYPERKALSEECPRYCLDRDQLARCHVMCECACVREVIQIIRERSRVPR
jgi:hypothetical protein